ncbi:MAG: efflux RND transporter periplasmic adaptor subunit [Candidatus Omnitrophica bacterium]|jgi:HlyD family secretion protein|nr:efflux RND transporter periplasmic adaptor subunit [Candidatus Omnitrophota bacterium]MDD5078630.1 efflux RND transporter periplasmic adaptor subunit [Candidatus Omnitrophota bacterium]MDD5725641.1 efflux RND transporter periplasmic adaptor subunit [Candidatus Omnitrophota bacterium]
MKKKLNLILIIILTAALGVLAFLYLQRRAEDKSRRIKVSGNIEGDDVRISFRVEGQIEELLVDEGYIVKKGDLVAKLKTDELTRIRDEAAGALKAAEYQYQLAKIDYQRAENLLIAGATTTQNRDQARTKMDSLNSEIQKLQASLDLAETRLGFANLVSPLNGFILVKSSLSGEVVQVGTPVFTCVDLNDIWVTGYINEKDLGRVKLNQDAVVTTDSYPGKTYKAKLSYISGQAEFTPKYIQTTEERVKYVYRVKVRVDNSSLDLKPGMPADAYITVD